MHDTAATRPIPTSTASSAQTTVIAAGVIGVALLHAVTLVALYAQVEPHPPAALGPFIAANLVLGIVALPLLSSGLRSGYATALGFALVSMVSFGPHKLLMENGLQIAPAAALGFALSLLVCVHAVRRLRGR